jgi:fermentation-respiration switch protein FrsA (DUF1100 family)
MQLLWRVFKWTGAVALVGYAGVCVALYAVQRTLVFPQLAPHVAAAAAGFPEAQEVTLRTADGERLIAWYVAPRQDKPMFVYFHGNGDTLNWRVDRDRKLVADGTGLLAVSYRGYEGSTGSPSEAGLMLDAEAAYDFAAARVAPQHILAWGHSLGTGVAVGLAASRQIGGLILEAPYTSIPDVASLGYPLLPMSWLLKDQFHSDRRIGQVSAPVLVLHGGSDETIPISFGERLYGLIRAPKRFVRFPEGGHLNLDDYGALAAVKEFVSGLAGVTATAAATR